MSDRPPTIDAPLDDDRRDCQPAIDALQRFLDGEPLVESTELTEHRSRCQACREEWSLAQLLNQPLPTPVVPASLVDRALHAVQSDRRLRRTRRWWSAGLSLAASLAFAIWLGSINPTKQQVTEVSIAARPMPSPDVARKPMPDPLAEARDVLASLTRLPGSIDAPKLNFDMVEPADSLEPLADARQGAERSMQPFANSARRALNVFLSPTPRPNKANPN